MGWMFVLGILALPLTMTHSASEGFAHSPKNSERVECAASFSDPHGSPEASVNIKN
jgi:hypothetical protein